MRAFRNRNTIQRKMERLFPLVLILLGIAGVLLVSHNDPVAASNDIVAVKERNENWLLSLPGVVGVGIGDCGRQRCIKVYAEQDTPDLARQIPQQIEGYIVDIEISGPIGILPAFL